MRPEAGEVAYKHINLPDLDNVAKDLIRNAGRARVWIFQGEMGSGKTTLIKAICRQLGVIESMSSPTFSIINEYEAQDGKRIFHFDFYRIQRESEAYDIGSEEYFYSGNYCFIEWPEKILSLIPAQYAAVHITTEDSNHRTIVISVHDGEEKNRI